MSELKLTISKLSSAGNSH